MIMQYLARGWRPVPLHHVLDSGACSCRRGEACPPSNRGKHPVYENWQKLLLGESTLRRVLDMRPRMNVGIATGAPSGFWALDVDDLGALNLLPVTDPFPMPFQRTGSGGLHYLFAMPMDFEPTNSAGRLPPGIDVRGTGGQIVVPPSVSGKGGYLALAGWPGVAPAPGALLDLVRPLPYAERPPAAPVTPSDAPEFLRATAYAQRIVQLECTELATETTTRNTRAFRAACRLHELINAGWTSYDFAEGQYLTAAEKASGNKPEPFGEHEAREVWAHAAMRVGDKAAELPPSALGGERLDFPQPPAGGLPSSSAGPAPSGSTFELQPGQVLSLAGSGPAPNTSVSLNLPAEFWQARPVLKHIRDAAHARIVSADVALYTVLARLSAMWPHKVRLDSGVRKPTAANTFVAVVGPSGAGKTSGVAVAEDLLPAPPWLAGAHRDKLADGLPLGTGEGIAEAFMGTAKRPVLDVDGNPVIMRSGEPKQESYRTQVRHNVFMYADEGESLAKLVERSGSTVGETLRRGWAGSTIGQSNGRAETTRIIERGRYSLGLVIGFQPETAQTLLADHAAGTPQRFLWCWATDPAIPDHPQSDPGPLTDVWPAPPEPPQVPGTPWLVDPGGVNDVDLRRVTYPPSVLAEVRTEAVAVGRGEASLPALDSHRPSHLIKLAALLAQLEGRRATDEQDWALAHTIWAQSCIVRDHLVRLGLDAAGKAAAARRAAFAGDHAAAESARLHLHDERERKQLTDLAHWAARKVAEAGRLRETDLRRQVGARRALLGGALSLAVELTLLAVDGDGYVRGPARLS